MWLDHFAIQMKSEKCLKPPLPETVSFYRRCCIQKFGMTWLVPKLYVSKPMTMAMKEMYSTYSKWKQQHNRLNRPSLFEVFLGLGPCTVTQSGLKPLKTRMPNGCDSMNFIMAKGQVSCSATHMVWLAVAVTIRIIQYISRVVSCPLSTHVVCTLGPFAWTCAFVFLRLTPQIYVTWFCIFVWLPFFASFHSWGETTCMWRRNMTKAWHRRTKTESFSLVLTLDFDLTFVFDMWLLTWLWFWHVTLDFRLDFGPLVLTFALWLDFGFDIWLLTWLLFWLLTFDLTLVFDFCFDFCL